MCYLAKGFTSKGKVDTQVQLAENIDWNTCYQTHTEKALAAGEMFMVY